MSQTPTNPDQPQQGYPQYPQEPFSSQGQYLLQQRYDGPPQGYPQYPQGQLPPQGIPQPGQYQPQQRYDGPPQGYPQYPPQGYQQPMQPVPKKKGRGLLIAGIIIVVLLFGCVGAGALAVSRISPTTISNTGSSKVGVANGITPTLGSTQTKGYKIGDVVQVGANWDVTLDGVKTSMGSGYVTPTTGMKFLIVSLSMKNLSAETQTVSSIVQFTLRGDDGTKYEVTVYPDAGSIIDGSVDAGQPAKGIIVYNIPTTTKTFHLKFESNPFEASPSSATWNLSV